ncbi:pantetheine-phosphate adenylyltransferase [Bremerella alba]|uniref:Phosphopantetheine adenylyltransferase n=1 Tax=Bremerella alba TaxID=980252 RepID=A0A7V8V6Q0_9BACT|nr:pantetheine-phosphate adenylyltransferase [Bremerella alba]MBA2115962.1 Phosphopantetheine adenylyltransferase [Bremerella alba]
MADGNRTAVFVGSFDPITLGHLNLIERSSKLVDRLIVGIGINAEKTGLFSPEERIDQVLRVTAEMPNVEAQTFDGLAVEFVRSVGACVMIRGIRPLTDIAGEFTMMMANRKLDSEIETIFLMADEQYGHVSSSLLKQITPLANDEQLEKFVPSSIIPDLRAKLVRKG